MTTEKNPQLKNSTIGKNSPTQKLDNKKKLTIGKTRQGEKLNSRKNKKFETKTRKQTTRQGRMDRRRAIEVILQQTFQQWTSTLLCLPDNITELYTVCQALRFNRTG